MSSASVSHAAMSLPGGGNLVYIACCMCGTPIAPNPASTCVDCIRAQVDITDGISKEVTMYQCRGCLKYQRPPWVHAELESAELLAICLKKIGGLNKVRLVDAGWIWTEPHSKRLKVKLTVQKEVMNGAVLQQAFVVIFVIKNQQCDECQAQYTSGNWKAVVQLRQKVGHKRSFFYLEQLILKHRAHEKCSNMESFPDGIDFYFVERSHALRFTDFLGECVPIRMKTAKKLISSDNHSNTYNYKFTFSTEIAPVCKDDLVVLPTKLAQSGGNIPNLCLVNQVTSSIHVIHPFTLQRAEIEGEKYWRSEFRALCSSKAMISFVVLDVEAVKNGHGKFVPHIHRKYSLAEVEVARESDFGVNDTRFHVLTHLGNLLKPGDTVMGYDLTSLNCNDADLIPLRERQAELPDIVLVKKRFARQTAASRKRNWTLKKMEGVEEGSALDKREAEKAEEDYEQFLQELEEDKDLRQKIDLFKVIEHAGKMTLQDNDNEAQKEEDYPIIPVEELLDDLSLSDVKEEAQVMTAEDAARLARNTLLSDLSDL